MNLDDPATRRALAACLAMPYTGNPLIDERLDLIRALAAGLEMLEKGRIERAAVQDLLARLDQAIAAVEENVRSLGERLQQLDAQASVAPRQQWIATMCFSELSRFDAKSAGPCVKTTKPTGRRTACGRCACVGSTDNLTDKARKLAEAGQIGRRLCTNGRRAAPRTIGLAVRASEA